MKGTIKVLKEGYGFLTSEDATTDIFFHANSLEGVDFDDLKPGQVLEFDLEEGRNGKEQAANVTLVEDAA